MYHRFIEEDIKMKKKALALMAVVGVVAMMAVGCGSSSKETEAATTEAATEAASEEAASEEETTEAAEADTTEAASEEETTEA